MKVVHFFNGESFFYVGVPNFEYDIEGAKYLMSCAGDAYSVLASAIGDNRYPQVKAAFDLVQKLQLRFEYRNKYNNIIPEYVNKGYDKYREVLDIIATNLAAELFYLNRVSAMEDDKGKAHYWDKIGKYETEAYKLLGELKDGKISLALEDGKTRTFDYRYSASNILEHRGKLFYAKDTRDMKDFEGEVERQFYKR